MSGDGQSGRSRGSHPPARPLNGAELARRRRDAGFTQESLAEHLVVSRSTVARWERGEGREPLPRLRLGLAQVLGVAVAELDRLLGIGSADDLDVVSRPDGQSQVVVGELVGEHFISQTVSESIGRLSPEELLRMSVRRARQFALSSQQYVAAEAIEALHEDVRDLARSYQQQPLTTILGDLVETQDVLYTMLEHRHRPAESKQLYLLAGVAGGLLAKASHDRGDSRSALSHARASSLCADLADSDGLRAWTRGLQSFICYWSQRLHEAIRYAEDGLMFAQSSQGTAGVWIAANEARAWATIGNASETQAAIARSEAAVGTSLFDDVDAFGGICTFGRSRQLYYAADALALLPDQAEEAERYAQEALQAYGDTTAPDWSFSDQAGSATVLALARIAKGETDGAAEAISPVLDLDAAHRIKGIVASVERIHRALGQMSRPSPEATTLQQAVEEFSRAPLAALTS